MTKDARYDAAGNEVEWDDETERWVAKDAKTDTAATKRRENESTTAKKAEAKEADK